MIRSDTTPLKHAGPSLLELSWRKLDGLVDLLMIARLNGNESTIQTFEIKYRAQGMVEIIAIFINPYNPNPNAVRVEAMSRWESRQS